MSDRIYLQGSPDVETSTWCRDKINDDDLEYVSVKQLAASKAECKVLEDMANVGAALMETLRQNMPDYYYNNCPSEVVCDLLNKLRDAENERAASKAECEALRNWLRMNCFAIKLRDANGVETEIVAEQDIHGTGAGDIIDAIDAAIGEKK